MATEQVLALVPLYQVLADAGVRLEHLQHEITAEIAGPEQHRCWPRLSAPLIRLNRLAFADGVPHHVLSTAESPIRSRILLTHDSADLEYGLSMAIAHDVLRPTS